MNVEQGLKVVPKLKSITVKMKLACADGYKADYDYRSNVPGARKPAQPDKTIISVIKELGRLAALYGDGQQAIDTVTEAVNKASQWRRENGYV